MAKRPKHHKLNARRLRFVAEYVLLAAAGEANGTQAAIRAGYSPRTARQEASRLLTHPDIQRLVAKKAQTALTKAAEVVENLDLSAQHVLEETARLAFSDIGGAFDATGTLLNINDIPPHVRRAISSVKVLLKDGRQVVEVKFWPKGPMLDLLAKYHHLIDVGAPPPPPDPARSTALVILVQRGDEAPRPLRSWKPPSALPPATT